MKYKLVFSIATVMALRMIGLFMIMPLLALYAMHLSGSTPLLLGLTLGIYGLTQALFQMPCGIISDFTGRKIVIVVGLSFFVLGSLIAASAQTIFAMMLGRAIQGAGAVGSTLMALLSDLTDEQHRAKAMAILGGVIGISFSFSLVLGPVLNAWLSVPGIFLLCAAMGIIAIAVLLFAIPTLKKEPHHLLEKFSFSTILSGLKRLLAQKKIVQYMVSSMLLHMLLIMNFIGVPVSLKDYVHLTQNQQWQIYLPVLLLSFLAAFIWIMLSEKRQRLNVSMALAIGFITLSQITLALFHYGFWSISIGLWLFFLGFNFLEAVLPAQLSKQVSIAERGMAMGLYSTIQFMGIFLGGLLGAAIYGYFSITSLFVFATIIGSLWLIGVLLNQHQL